MNINNLEFFDKNGNSYNFTQDENLVWIGNDYFLPISVGLYDVSNIFILEKTEAGYKFPILDENSSISVKWKTPNNKLNFFIFNIYKETINNKELSFINKLEDLTILHSDFNQSGSLNLQYPLQLNIAFNPTEEKIYDRILEIYYNINGTSTKIAAIYFYGEGEDEDERFNIWLNNFGIKFNKEDALILKDYDLTEGLPDWTKINVARKELLVNRNEIYPYIGTYRGLSKIIGLLGYSDILKIKEYWQDVSESSPYFGKYAMVDISELLKFGEIDSLNLVSLNKQIKFGGKFKKTEFLALSYEFSKATGSYDSDNLPEIEYTTEFNTNELFYKLNKLSVKLKNEILPVNVIIKDIIGEFIYFTKFGIKQWIDDTIISGFDSNDAYSIEIVSPNLHSQELLIRDIKTLYPKLNNSEFPEISFNTSSIIPYSNNQVYNIVDLPNFNNAIFDYYNNLEQIEFQYHGDSYNFGITDDSDGEIGCPIVLKASIHEPTIDELRNCVFSDFINSQITLDSVKYKNAYEIEWIISNRFGYYFSWRDSISKLHTISHIFPNSGQYIITIKVYDLSGGVSIFTKTIDILETEPIISVFTKLQDTQNYTIDGLANIKLSDMDQCPLFLPYLNIYQQTSSDIQIPTHYLDWFTYLNDFGVGSQHTNVEIYNDRLGYQSFQNSTNPLKKYWGVGSSYTGQPTLSDYSEATIDDLKLNRICDLSYSYDKLAGFIIDLSNFQGSLAYINLKDWQSSSNYTVLPYSNLDELVDQLNLATYADIDLFTYKKINSKIYATAKSQEPKYNRIIKLIDSLNNFDIVYSFSRPVEIFSNELITLLNSQLSTLKLAIDDSLLFLEAPFADILYKLGETCISNTEFTMNQNIIGTTLSFDLTKPTNFVENSIVRAISIDDSQIWVEGIVSQESELVLNITVSSISGESLTSNNWEFIYISKTYANAANIQYWLDLEYIKYINGTLFGYLPSLYNSSSLSLTKIKLNNAGYIIPVHQPIFVVVQNINSKKSCIWTLYLNDTELIKVKTNSYFIWRFNKPGNYKIQVKIIDSNSNTSSTLQPIQIASVLNINSYISNIETWAKLNRQ